MGMMECKDCLRMADLRFFRGCVCCGAPLCDECSMRNGGLCDDCASQEDG